MAGPWEKYQSTPTPDGSPTTSVTPDQPQGPWSKYQQPAATAADPSGAVTDQSNTGAALRLAARTPLHAIGSILDLPGMVGRGLGEGIKAGVNWVAPGTLTEQAPPLASFDEALVKAPGALGGPDIQMDPNAGTAMRAADFAAPFVAQEAATMGMSTPLTATSLGGKLLEGGVKIIPKAVARGGADAALTAAGATAGGDIGQHLGGDTGRSLGETIGGIAGGTARHVGAPLVVAAARKGFDVDAADAAKTFQAGENEGVGVSPGMVLGPGMQKVEQSLTSVPGLSMVTGKAAREAPGQIEAAAHDVASGVAGEPITGAMSPGQVGEPVVSAAKTELDRSRTDVGQQYSSAEQALQGAHVDAASVIQHFDNAIANSAGDERALLIKRKNDLLQTIEDTYPGQEQAIKARQAEIDRVNAGNTAAAQKYLADQATYKQFMNDTSPYTATWKGKTDPRAQVVSDWVAKHANNMRSASGSNKVFQSLMDQMSKGKSITIDPSMAGKAAFDELKQALNPAPKGRAPRAKAAPPPLTRQTKIPWQKARKLRTDVIQDPSVMGGRAKGQALQDVRKQGYTTALRDAGNRHAPGAGDAWDKARKAYFDAQDKHEFLESNFTGERNRTGGYQKAKGGQEVGGQVKKMLEGGDDTALKFTRKNLGQATTAKALGRELSTAGHPGSGKRVVKSSKFSPGQYAEDVSRIGKRAQRVMDVTGRQTTKTGVTRTVGERISDLAQLGKKAEIPPSSRGLTDAITRGGTIQHALTSVKGVAGLAAAGVLHRVLSDPKSLRAIAKQGGIPVDVGRIISKGILAAGMSHK